MSTRGLRASLAAFATAFAIHGGPALAETRAFHGYARDLDSGRYLYTEVQFQEIEADRWIAGTIDYYGPDNAHLGHKSLDFSANPYVPLFQMQLSAPDYAEGIDQVSAGAVTLFRDDRGKREVGEVKLPRTAAADAGFHPLIVDRFDQLLAGESFDFELVVAGKLSSFGFRVVPDGRTETGPNQRLRLRVEAASTLLRWVAPKLRLEYRIADRRLMRYRGISNLLNPDDGRAYNVQIDYTESAPDDAPSPLPPLVASEL